MKKAVYEIPETVFIPMEGNSVICVSDGENEDTGEEPWN